MARESPVIAILVLLVVAVLALTVGSWLWWHEERAARTAAEKLLEFHARVERERQSGS